ncbi:hypothetical protein HanHA300_Chr11g0419861 [Helianthus annuus]|nr:hypothetical protein HanHA300_Chr11g0419861 [Helianthus annuus]KAJ0519015.1 hypothetical protein HanHA89_Chr11g0443871 [Helianthus annuus]KAJ0687015.1 hypothetical protein HanLR1_Chr11g0421161 [Helianthus annuus]
MMKLNMVVFSAWRCICRQRCKVKLERECVRFNPIFYNLYLS